MTARDRERADYFAADVLCEVLGDGRIVEATDLAEAVEAAGLCDDELDEEG
jgi:hypothetical protein